MTEREGLQHDPIHFDEFQEIEETDFRSDKLNMLRLLVPESAEAVQPDEEDQDRNSLLPESNHLLITQELLKD